MPPAFLCDGVRTPFGRFGGALSTVRVDDLAAVPLRALRERHPAIDWEAVDEVVLGCANQSGEDNRNVARMALLLAGIPLSVPGVTVNRLCGSSLEAIADAARRIHCGEADLIIAGGVEGMTRAPYIMAKADAAFSRGMKLEDSTLGWRLVNPEMHRAFGTESMAETAENVANEHGISRDDQDAFAHRSQRRAAAAAQAGIFAEEITPVSIRQKKSVVTVTVDEHPRPDTTLEALGKLAPITRPTGTITAGNASGINDGAAALILASEAGVRRHGLTPFARVVASAVAGVAPRVMGIGPIPATTKLLAKSGLTIGQIDLIEINEAFAAQVLASLRGLGVADDAPHVNPNGGAIAIGHPLGASGARLATTAMYQLRRTGGRYAVCTMCIGVGQGIALLLERA
ncbi:MAG: 3-oxoadipyl-CoA thiolase [Acidobacteriota bacterium]